MIGVLSIQSLAAQAVAVQGAHKHYQLQQADLTCSSLSELTVYNIRRLFALKVSIQQPSCMAPYTVGAQLGWFMPVSTKHGVISEASID